VDGWWRDGRVRDREIERERGGGGGEGSTGDRKFHPCGAA